MPTPLGHALGGFVAGWIITGPGPWRGRAGSPDTRGRGSALLPALGFALVGMAPDLDLLVGRHSQFSHSVGATAAVFAVALLVSWLWRRPRALLLALAVAAAYASHPLLDWLAEDATPPRGIMALWPFSTGYHLSHADIFRGIARYYWRPGALQQNALAVARELLILGPLAIGAWWVRGNRKEGRWQILRGASREGRQALRSRAAARGEGESPLSE